jgi:hypothetical protein
MQMNRFIIAVLLLASLSLASPAFAYKQNQTPNDGQCGFTMNPDECMWGGAPATGGNYSSCTAKGSEDQQCVDVVMQIGGPYECAKVYRSAYCGCNTTTLKKTGTCTYVP